MDIFVGNLSFDTTEQELWNEFKAFGEIGSVKIITDPETSKSRGFAFVRMPVQEHANAAIIGLNGKVINGFALKVNEARPRGSGPSPKPSGASGYPTGPRREPNSGFANRSPSYLSDGRNNDIDIYDTKGAQNRKGSGRKERRGHNDSGGRTGGKKWH